MQILFTKWGGHVAISHELSAGTYNHINESNLTSSMKACLTHSTESVFQGLIKAEEHTSGEDKPSWAYCDYDVRLIEDQLILLVFDSHLPLDMVAQVTAGASRWIPVEDIFVVQRDEPHMLRRERWKIPWTWNKTTFSAH